MYRLGDHEPEYTTVVVFGREMQAPVFTHGRYSRRLMARLDDARQAYLELLELGGNSNEAREDWLTRSVSLILPELTEEEADRLTSDEAWGLLRYVGYLRPAEEQGDPPAEAASQTAATPSGT